MQKLTNQQINAVAHNLIIGTVLESAWDFVCSLAPTNEFDYAFTNTASEDYCDTIWHTTQNVKLHESLDLIDARDMYDNAVGAFNNFVNTNLADLTVEEVYATLDDISGDTAMRDNYYAQLRSHFAKFVADNPLFALEETEYDYCYKLVSTHNPAQKSALVREYVEEHDAVDYIELNNDLA
tara:strand:- start:115 stop:657 length:543 start_codon:yes stop_codon:yes gene_type:complete